MPTREKSADALLFAMGGAMFLITVLACVMIVVPSFATLAVAYGALVAAAIVVGFFIHRFIDAEH